MAWANPYRVFTHPIALLVAFVWVMIALLWIVLTSQQGLGTPRLSQTILWMVRVAALMLSTGAMIHMFRSHRLYVSRPLAKRDLLHHVRPTHMIFFLGYSCALGLVCSGFFVYKLSAMAMDFFAFALLGVIALISWSLFWISRYRGADETSLTPGWTDEN
jgi:hypothetical protein